MVSGVSSISTSALTQLWQQMFSKIDTSGDGSIDKSEMTALIEGNTSSEESTSSLVSSIFSSQDTNQDDLISQIEFESSMAQLGHKMKQSGSMSGASGMSGPPPTPEKVFDTADTNEDGVVTKDELAAVMGNGGGSIDEMFSQVDTDGDGEITRAEDEAFRAKMSAQMEQGNTSRATGTSSDQNQNWQVKMLSALLQSLTASAGSSGETTSSYA
jgi:Ca2+-binding EF-hand superfamily protein